MTNMRSTDPRLQSRPATIVLNVLNLQSLAEWKVKQVKTMGVLFINVAKLPENTWRVKSRYNL